jgi:hypothetical protein
MSTNLNIRRPAGAAFALSATHWLDWKRPGARLAMNQQGTIVRPGLAPCMLNCFLCVSLWLSLVLAIWMSRGWIGLLFSGQILSAGACVFQWLTRRTQCALVRCGTSANR